MAQQPGIHAGANAPAYVFGRKNLDYVGKKAGENGSVSGDLSSARGDFDTGKSTEDIKYDIVDDLHDKIDNLNFYKYSSDFYKTDPDSSTGFGDHRFQDSFVEEYAELKSEGDDKEASRYYMRVRMFDDLRTPINQAADREFVESPEFSSKYIPDGLSCSKEGYIDIPADYFMEHSDDQKLKNLSKLTHEAADKGYLGDVVLQGGAGNVKFEDILDQPLNSLKYASDNYKFGGSVEYVGKVDLGAYEYDFDDIRIYKKSDGKYLYGRDMGDGSATPFETMTFNDLTEIETTDNKEVIKMILREHDPKINGYYATRSDVKKSLEEVLKDK